MPHYWWQSVFSIFDACSPRCLTSSALSRSSQNRRLCWFYPSLSYQLCQSTNNASNCRGPNEEPPLRHWNIKIVLDGPGKEEVAAGIFSSVEYRLHETFEDRMRQGTSETFIEIPESWSDRWQRKRTHHFRSKKKAGVNSTCRSSLKLSRGAKNSRFSMISTSQARNMRLVTQSYAFPQSFWLLYHWQRTLIWHVIVLQRGEGSPVRGA